MKHRIFVLPLLFLMSGSLIATAQSKRRPTPRITPTTTKISLIGTTWKIFETINGKNEWGTYTFLADGKVEETEGTKWKLIGNKIHITEEYGDIELVIAGNRMTGTGQLGMNPRPFPMVGEKIAGDPSMSPQRAEKPLSGDDPAGAPITRQVGGDYFVQIYGASVLRLYQDVAAPNTIYATTPLGVSRSTDGGNLWVPILTLSDFGVTPAKENEGSSPRVVLFAQSKSSPEVSYVAASPYKIWRTGDRGKTWADITAGVIGADQWTPHSLRVSSTDPNLVYAIFDEEMLKTMNGGKSWGRLPSPPIDQQAVTGLNLDVQDDKHLLFSYGAYHTPTISEYESKDGGMTWQAAANNWPVSSTNSVLATPGAFRLSVDSGRTWKRIGFDDPRKGRNLDGTRVQAEIKTAAFVGNSLLVGTDTGLFESTDRGTSYHQLIPGVFSDIFATADGSVLAASDFGLIRFSLPDIKWTWSGFGLPRKVYDQNFLSLVPCSADDATNSLMICTGSQVALTTDGGRTFQWKKIVEDDCWCRNVKVSDLTDGSVVVDQISLGQFGERLGKNIFVKITPTGISSILFQKDGYGVPGAVSAANTKIYYSGGFLSDDAGFSWRKMNLGSASADSNQLLNYVSPVNAATAYIFDGSNRTLYGSTDAGETWHLLRLPDNFANRMVLVPDTRDERIVYVSNGENLYRSSDKGATWTQIRPGASSFGEINGFTISGADPNTIFVASRSGVWRSQDRGRTWLLLAAGFNGDSPNTVLSTARFTVVSGTYGVYLLRSKSDLKIAQ